MLSHLWCAVGPCTALSENFKFWSQLGGLCPPPPMLQRSDDQHIVVTYASMPQLNMAGTNPQAEVIKKYTIGLLYYFQTYIFKLII